LLSRALVQELLSRKRKTASRIPRQTYGPGGWPGPYLFSAPKWIVFTSIPFWNSPPYKIRRSVL
jgi:hypothetical protein